MRLAAQLAAAPAALALGAAPAAAGPPLRDVGPAMRDGANGRALLASDGQRVAYAPAPSRIRVIGRDLREVASIPTPSGCAWGDFGGGALLWYCDRADGQSGLAFHGIVYDVAARAVTQLQPPPVPASTATGDLPTWWTIGRHWLGADYISSGVRQVAFVNRATGQVIPYAAVAGSIRDGRRVTPDLDRADLMRPLCAPLRPRAVRDDRGEPVPARFAYSPPYGATRSSTPGGTRLLLGRCGDRATSVLSRCPRTCADPAVGDRAVAWLEGTSQTTRTLRVRLIDRARTWSWRVAVPPDRRGSADPLVAVLGRRVFVLGEKALKTVLLPPVARRR
jgi:hypothetical protein